MNFNETKDSYRADIEKTISFAGQGLDFFTKVKSDYMKEIVARELPSIARPRLLDVGCGHGFIHPYLLESGFDITGVEIAEEVLEAARIANPSCAYLGYDGQHLPFAAASFDVTMAICVMHHVPPAQWQVFINEMHRILRPGGLAVIFEHNPFNPLTQYVVRSSEIDADAVLLRPKLMRNLLDQAGFADVISRNILFTTFDNPPFRLLDRALGWCPLGAQYYTQGKVA